MVTHRHFTDRRVEMMDARNHPESSKKVNITLVEEPADLLTVAAGVKDGTGFPDNEQWRQTRRSYILEQSGGSFYGTKNLDEANDLLKNGWPEGAKRVEELCQRLLERLPPAKSIARKRVWNETQGPVSVSRWLKGNPKLFRGMKRGQTRARPVVHVLIPFSTVNWITTEQMFWNGAVGAAITKLLEAAGYRVAVDAVGTDWHRESKTINVTVVQVKKAHERLNEATMAYCLAHASFVRRHSFCLSACEPKDIVDYGFGVPDNRGCSPDSLYLLRDENIVTEDAILIPRCHNEEEAMREIEKMLEALTGQRVRVPA